MSAYGGFARVYDALMDDVDYAAWARFYCEIAGVGEGSRVCETACGTGSLSIELAKAGIRLVASDISASMLEAAAEKARKSGVVIPFVQEDMRRLTLHRPMDAIICACDGVNYLTEGIDAFFRAAYDYLRIGGALAFDISSPEKLSGMDGQVYLDDRDALTAIWTNRFDAADSLLHTELTVFLREGDVYRRFDEAHLQKAYTARQISQTLEQTGFASVRVIKDRDFFRGAIPGQGVHFVAEK